MAVDGRLEFIEKEMCVPYLFSLNFPLYTLFYMFSTFYSWDFRKGVLGTTIPDEFEKEQNSNIFYFSPI